MKPSYTFALAFCLLAGLRFGAAQNPDRAAGITTVDIAPVWAGHPVGFALLTHGGQQFAAFYDAARRMTVAQRTLGQRAWRFTTLPSTVGWDSHNGIVLGVDRAGFLHVAGNMHASTMVYFRAKRPDDAASLERVAAMTTAPEDRVTYPVFSHAPDGALLFQYRLGRSGQGDTFTNRYDETTRSWSALTTQPLFSGEGHRNAYPLHPVLGPDGWYHQVWVWRETPDAATNHDLSYARSRDLVHWETAAGRPLTLPLTLEAPGLIIDPVPAKGGLLNGLQSVGFDAEQRVLVAYTRYDAGGNNQLFIARREGAAWHIVQASDWHYRWDFHGEGSLNFEIHLGPIVRTGNAMSIEIQHKIDGEGTWSIDPETLRLTAVVGRAAAGSEAAASGVSIPGTEVLVAQSAGDSGGPRQDGVRYRLLWQTLPENRDQPRPGAPPPPSMLRLSMAY